MARRKLTIELAPIVAGLLGATTDDVSVASALDATEALLREHGLSGWSVEDVAERAGVGRTTVYRRFPSRDDLVHGVLARELRRTIDAIGRAVTPQTSLEDRIVEATSVALASLERSVVDHLLRSDPHTVLPFLTTGAGPLIALARTAFAPALVGEGVAPDLRAAAPLAEALARLGLSFVLTRATVLPVQDPVALRGAVRSLVGPMLTAAR